MGIRELREAYWKACTWRPPVVAIIEYLARLDIRFAAMSQKVDAIDVEQIEEIESQFGGLVSNVEDISQRVGYLEFRMEDVEGDIAGAHLEWIDPDHEDIGDLKQRMETAEDSIADLKDDVEDLQDAVAALDPTAIAALQRQMQGAYVRFAGSSDSTSTTSPYRKILSIDANSSKVYDDDIQLDMTTNANCVKFLAAGRVELTFSCKFTGPAAGQHIAINSSNVPSTGATQIALSKGTWEEPLLNAIFEVSANAHVYMFAGGASNSARTFTPNSPMTYVHARYIEKY